jgi:hypothetical protein
MNAQEIIDTARTLVAAELATALRPKSYQVVPSANVRSIFSIQGSAKWVRDGAFRVSGSDTRPALCALDNLFVDFIRRARNGAVA